MTALEPTPRQRTARRLVRVVAGIVGSALVLLAISGAIDASRAFEEVQTFKTLPRCAHATQQSCMEAGTVTVVDARERGQRRVTIEYAGERRHVRIFEDYGLRAHLVTGARLGATLWPRGRIVVVADPQRRAFLTDESPHARGSDAWGRIGAGVVGLPFALAGVVGLRTPRPAAPLGMYTLPQRIRPTRRFGLLLFALALAWGIFTVADPFRYTLLASRPLATYAPLVLWAFIGLINAVALGTSGVDLHADRLVTRAAWRRRSIDYADIERVTAVADALVLHRRDGRSAVTVALRNMNARDRAVIEDVLKQQTLGVAPSVERAMEHAAAGALRPSFKGGLELLRWQRMTEQLASMEIFGMACAAVGVLMFAGLGIAVVVFERNFGAGALMLAGVAFFALIGPLSLVYRERLRRLKRRLASVGRETEGRVVDLWDLALGQGFSALEYTFTDDAGKAHVVRTWDATPVVRRWHVGDTGRVRFDPADPRAALWVVD